MGNGPNVLTLLDRFTFSSVGGVGSIYTPWVNVPTWCHTADVVFECFAFNRGGPVDMVFQSSMDKAEVASLATEPLSGPGVAEEPLTKGLARYARVELTPQGVVPVNMVLSAHLILRTAE
jgi:hypothetical protein